MDNQPHESHQSAIEQELQLLIQEQERWEKRLARQAWPTDAIERQ